MKIDRNGAFHGEDGKYISKNGLVKISLDFFAEKDLEKQKPSQIRKGIKSLQKSISIHEYKLSHPQEFHQDWGEKSEERREKALFVWRKEIFFRKREIQDRIDKLKEMGETYEESQDG